MIVERPHHEDHRSNNCYYKSVQEVTVDVQFELKTQKLSSNTNHFHLISMGMMFASTCSTLARSDQPHSSSSSAFSSFPWEQWRSSRTWTSRWRREEEQRTASAWRLPCGSENYDVDQVSILHKAHLGNASKSFNSAEGEVETSDKCYLEMVEMNVCPSSSLATWVSVCPSLGFTTP